MHSNTWKEINRIYYNETFETRVFNFQSFSLFQFTQKMENQHFSNAHTDVYTVKGKPEYDHLKIIIVPGNEIEWRSNSKGILDSLSSIVFLCMNYTQN